MANVPSSGGNLIADVVSVELRSIGVCSGCTNWQATLVQVGIIPTDSLPAVVCDLQNRNAVLKLYNVMELSAKKPLSILCRNFSDISHYTLGFPVPKHAGQVDMFSVVRRLLPGPVSRL